MKKIKQPVKLNLSSLFVTLSTKTLQLKNHDTVNYSPPPTPPLTTSFNPATHSFPESPNAIPSERERGHIT